MAVPQQKVPVIRPMNTNMGPVFRAKLNEAINMRFELAVQASQYSADRMSFEWQSIGSRLLMNPAVNLVVNLRVQGPGALQDALSRLPAYRPHSTSAQNLNSSGILTGAAVGQEYANYLCFGEGDCFSDAIDDISVTVNSQSMSSDNRGLFWRSLMRHWVSPEATASIYQNAGGAVDAYDNRSVGGMGRSNAAISGVIGSTIDSGVARRNQVFMSRSVPEAGTANTFSRTIRCKIPITAGLFHHYAGRAGISASSPLVHAPYALCNYNTGSMTLLLKNFKQCMIKNLGRLSLGGANATGTNTGQGGITVDIIDKPTLFIEFLRLQSFRKFPSSLSYSLWRTRCITHDKMTSDAKGSYILPDGFADTDNQRVLPPVGRDFKVLDYTAGSNLLTQATGLITVQRFPFRDDFRWDCEWPSIQLSSLPEWFLIVGQKSTDMYSLGDAVSGAGGPRQYPFGLTDLGVGYAQSASAAAGGGGGGAAEALLEADALLTIAGERNRCRQNALNRSSNLTICRLEFIIMNGSGSFSYTSNDAPWQKDIDRLYEVTRKNSVPQYMEGAGQSDWEDRCCSVLLHETDVNYGISGSSVAYPVSVSIRATLQNRCRFTDGVIFTTKSASFPFVSSCPVNAQPVVCAVYTNSFVTVDENSATKSSFIISQATLTEALVRSGRENE